MATPKRLTKEQANENEKKQQVLRTAGYNVKVDGSWGPWQEKQYRKVMASRSRKGQANQANAAALALPAAGYAASQLLGGIGASLPSFALPAISGSTLAAAAPIALVLAGPVSGLYDTITGRNPQLDITSQERQAMAYAPDATRVSRPIVVSRTRVGSQSRPIGEMYINPTLIRSRAINMATETANDSTTVTSAPRDSATVTSQNPPNPTNDNKPQNKRGWRDKLADRVANKIRGKKNTNNQPSTPEQPKKGNTSEKFGKGLKTAYKWSWYVPTAIDVVGNVAGAVRNINTYSPSLPALEGRTALIRGGWNWLGRQYNPQATDSTTVIPPNNPNKLKANQDTTNRYSTLDSIRAAAQRASLSYLDSLESNQ